MKSKIVNFQFLVHNENDAYKLIDSLDTRQLRKLILICFDGLIAYTVYLDMYKGCVITTCYPFSIKVNHPLRSCFREAVFAIYHSNFL